MRMSSRPAVLVTGNGASESARAQLVHVDLDLARRHLRDRRTRRARRPAQCADDSSARRSLAFSTSEPGWKTAVRGRAVAQVMRSPACRGCDDSRRRAGPGRRVLRTSPDQSSVAVARGSCLWALLWRISSASIARSPVDRRPRARFPARIRIAFGRRSRRRRADAACLRAGPSARAACSI